MSSVPGHPGVFVEEIPSGVSSIVGVETSITAFIGRARMGPVNEPTPIQSFGGFERFFGGLWEGTTLGFAVRDFFLNGGSKAILVRITHPDATAATPVLGDLHFRAANPGTWGGELEVSVDSNVTRLEADVLGVPLANLFNLTVRHAISGGATERFANVTVEDHPRRLDRVLEAESVLLRWDGVAVPAAPSAILTALANASTSAAEATTTLAAATPGTPAHAAARTALANALAALTTISTAVTPKAAFDITAATVASAESTLATAQDAIPQIPAEIIAAEIALRVAQKASTAAQAMAGSDGSSLETSDFESANSQVNHEGLYALEKADIFNLLCIPPFLNTVPDTSTTLIGHAAQYCAKRRAMLIIDPPSNWNSSAKALNGMVDRVVDQVGTRDKNAALFFPRLRQPNPLENDQVQDFAPCGAVAGVFARTDATRGVWKAPAGLEAGLLGVPQLTVLLTDAEIGELNPRGVNCLRSVPGTGLVVWGSRTLEGDDRLGSEWKYIPVRRTALFIEESLNRGTRWVVFEPNDEPLWAQIRLSVEAFMHDLFRKGAFQGTTPRDAYLVKCDSETTTQNDINRGVVNIVVGFAPLKPAEFVIIKLRQLAGQIIRT